MSIVSSMRRSCTWRSSPAMQPRAGLWFLLTLSFNSLSLEWARPPTENGIAHTPAGIVVSLPLPARLLESDPGLHRNRRRVPRSVSRNYRLCRDFVGYLGDSGTKI